MKIYKFTKNTVELSQYYKTIDSIHSIIIVGNTCGLCGWFDMIEDKKKKWEGLVPASKFDNCSAADENLEVLAALINNKAEIVIVCDNEDTKTYWETVYHYFCVRFDKEEIRNFKMIDSIKENEDYETVMKDINAKVEKRKHKFDVAFINPPYSGDSPEMLEYKFANLCQEFCNEVLYIGPETGLFGVPHFEKSKDIAKKRLDNIVNNSTSIQLINGNDFFDAEGLGGKVMSITHINTNGTPGVNVINTDGSVTRYNDFDHMTRIIDINDCHVVTFSKVIQSIINANGSIKDKLVGAPKTHYPNFRISDTVYVEKKRNNNIYCVNIPTFIGSKKQGSTDSVWWTILGSNCNTGLYNEIVTDNTYYIPFESKMNAEMFVSYTKSFFARLCVKLLKKNYNNVGGYTLTYVPWFDFSDPMFASSPEDIDVALFRKYGISQQIVDHILEVLPNYYNLDLTKYKNI